LGTPPSPGLGRGEAVSERQEETAPARAVCTRLGLDGVSEGIAVRVLAHETRVDDVRGLCGESRDAAGRADRCSPDVGVMIPLAHARHHARRSERNGRHGSDARATRRRQDSNLQLSAPKAAVLPLELPPSGALTVALGRPDAGETAAGRAPDGGPGIASAIGRRLWKGPRDAARVAPLMGSLIKKRRKRMRKKKHKKMLKRTRWQRRAAGK
jgi:hypothetical protein